MISMFHSFLTTTDESIPLPTSRRLVGGTDINIVDGGAGGNLTIHSTAGGSPESHFVMQFWCNDAAGTGRFFNTGTYSTAYDAVCTPIPVATQLQSIYVHTQTSLLVGLLTIQIWHNGGATLASAVIALGQDGNATGIGLALAAGDTISPYMTFTGTDPGNINVSMRFGST